MTDAPRPQMILVAGLSRSGTGDEPGELEANVRAMNETALGQRTSTPGSPTYRPPGITAEGEDIITVELPFTQALAMIRSGAIADAGDNHAGSGRWHAGRPA